MRQIEVIRNGEKVATLDVYNYLFDGDNSENPQLQDQDLIVVKPYINRVWFAGNVKYPAIYELKANESIADLLSVSGGFTSSAFKKSLTINRSGEEQRKVATFFESNYDKVELIDGDSIFVSKISDRYSNRVKVEGSVIREGYFELTDDLTLSKAMKLAGGLREDAYLGRANIIRLTSDLRLTNISFNVKNVLSGSEDVILKSNDIVRIQSIFQLEEDRIVSLLGEVRKPGDYPFIDSMTVEDLVTIAGGLREKASKSTVEVARRLSNNNDITKTAEIFTFTISENFGLSSEASDFILKPFDLITIKSSSYKQIQKVVKIEGEVKYPGYYVLKTNEDRISDLVKRAGGLTDYGYAEGASLIRRTEYFRTEYQKEELETLLKTKREELEERYSKIAGTEELSPIELIEREMIDYESELTENIKRSENSSELEARIFRAQQLRKLQKRDESSLVSLNDVVEQQSVGIELDEIIQKQKSEYDLILKDGDLISVPRRLETVKVQGEVLFPNSVRFSSGMSLKKYISQAGGFSNEAKQGKTYIVYANGSAKRTKKFFWINIYPNVKPGADIVVPKKEPRRKITPQEVVTIASS
ncbi:MAG: SLBB domain-containing protein, partial [Bacteroidota bacterium]